MWTPLLGQRSRAERPARAHTEDKCMSGGALEGEQLSVQQWGGVQCSVAKRSGRRMEVG